MTYKQQWVNVLTEKRKPKFISNNPHNGPTKTLKGHLTSFSSARLDTSRSNVTRIKKQKTRPILNSLGPSSHQLIVAGQPTLPKTMLTGKNMSLIKCLYLTL